MMEGFITIDEALALHAASLRAYGGSDGIRDRGMLESAIAQPMMSFANQPLYQTVFEKAAALGYSLICNHAFVDGNKRVGLAAMALFLKRNGYSIVANPDSCEQTILAVASSTMDRAQLSAWLQVNCRSA